MGDMKHVPNWGPYSFGVECEVVQLGANNRNVAGSFSDVCNRYCTLISSFRPQHGPGVDSTSNGNKYQVYFLEVRTAGA
jgi:hypothetical protein